MDEWDLEEEVVRGSSLAWDIVAEALWATELSQVRRCKVVSGSSEGIDEENIDCKEETEGDGKKEFNENFFIVFLLLKITKLDCYYLSIWS